MTDLEYETEMKRLSALMMNPTLSPERDAQVCREYIQLYREHVGHEWLGEAPDEDDEGLKGPDWWGEDDDAHHV